MPFLPSSILGMWFRGLLAIAILAGSIYLLRQWSQELPQPAVRRGGEVTTSDDSRRTSRAEDRPAVEVHRPAVAASFSERLAAWRPGFYRQTALLAGGLALALLGLGGRFFASSRLFRRPGGDEPEPLRSSDVHRLRRPDGTTIQVELFGPADAPQLILTHGWGNDSDSFYYVKRQLSDRFRLICWDLPGHGRSTRAQNNDYSTERLAQDLRAVVDMAAPGPVTLVGHSLGGMTVLTFCRLFPELAGTRVRSLVLVHTTYTNPLRTMRWGSLYSALQKPLIEPLLHLTVWLSPLAWLMNWLSYLNGSAHRSTARQSFAGTETRGQLDFAARYTVQTSPAVLARGALGMLRYDVRDILPAVPVKSEVVAAESDPVCQPEASRVLATELPEARCDTLAPARHLGLLERNTEFSALLKREGIRAPSEPKSSDSSPAAVEHVAR